MMSALATESVVGETVVFVMQGGIPFRYKVVDVGRKM